MTGTTPRTIRYYEEIGLLPGLEDRAEGKHRCYSADDVQRINEIVRFRDLLGLSLEQLSKLLEAETARAELKLEYRRSEDPRQRRRILQEALEHLATQLELVSDRRRELGRLAAELTERRAQVLARLAELDSSTTGSSPEGETEAATA